MILWGKTEPRPAYLKEKLRVESAHDLRARLITRCRELDFDRQGNDVAPFLYRPEDAKRVRLFPEFIENYEFKL
jgi:hypothetical protein